MNKGKDPTIAMIAVLDKFVSSFDLFNFSEQSYHHKELPGGLVDRAAQHSWSSWAVAAAHSDVDASLPKSGFDRWSIFQDKDQELTWVNGQAV